MRKINDVETRLDNEFDNLYFGYWNPKTEEFIPLDGTENNEKLIQKETGLNSVALDCLSIFSGDIQCRLNALNSDIKELAKKIL